MLRGFGYPVEVHGATAKLESNHKLTGTRIEVPADISSAAFFMVAASIAPDSEVLLEHVGINPTRTGVIDILRLMGADLSLERVREVGGELVADIRVRSAKLKGIDIPLELVPLAIDEFPVLFIAAACAEGRTVLRGAEELRVKESDRIQVMVDGLTTLGIDAKDTQMASLLMADKWVEAKYGPMVITALQWHLALPRCEPMHRFVFTTACMLLLRFQISLRFVNKSACTLNLRCKHELTCRNYH